MSKYIPTPFAVNGDKEVIPQTDPGGSVNWNLGYPLDYSKDPETDPSAKRIGRESFNGLLNYLSGAIQEIQQSGIAPYINPEDNNDINYPYGKGAVVIYNKVVYQSLVDNNSTLPTDPSKWSTMLTDEGGSPYPVGSPIPWPTSIPPVGYIAMTGQAFSGTLYPKLALAYPGLVIPDMRAEFIRGWDNGRLVDAGRSLISFQLDDNRTHNHSLGFGYNTDESQNLLGALIGDPVAMKSVTPTTIQDSSSYRVSMSGGNESRPRNIAFNYIVRAA